MSDQQSSTADTTVKSGTVKKVDNYDKHIPTHQKIFYGFGDFGNGFMFDLGQAYLTKFWIDAAGIGAGAVAGIFAFTKIFDAFMDPIAGSFVDGRKNIGKRGKFRPVMMISAIILGIMTIVTFTMPMGLSTAQKIIYAYIVYMIWGVVYSFTNDPYGSLASVMTRNPQDRSFMATTRQVGSVGAQFIAGVAFIPLMELVGGGMSSHDQLHGYFFAATVFAIIGICMFAVCYFGTKENVKVHRDKHAKREGFKDYIKVVFTNGPLGALILMTLFTISAMNTNNQMMVFYAQYNLGNIGLQPVINAIMMGCSIVGVFMIPALTKRFGQKRTAMIAGARFIVSPSYNEEVAKLCNLYAVPYMPGCFTPTEVQQALSTGADVIKIFPGAIAGQKMIPELQGPFPQANIMPSGGVSLDNMADWFKAGAFVVGAGGSLVGPGADGDYDQVEENAKRFHAEFVRIKGNN